jgi:hypothetical protein
LRPPDRSDQPSGSAIAARIMVPMHAQVGLNQDKQSDWKSKPLCAELGL